MRWSGANRESSSSETTAPRELAPGKVTHSERIQRRASGASGSAVPADPDAAVASTSGSIGAPLPEVARARFESSLSSDLSSVRVHTGGASASAAEGLGARAFAVGQDIHFGAGQYQPDDPFGMHLLAHEVAHTVQQSGSGPRMKLEVSEPGDAFEVEADRAADAMVSGAPASIGGGAVAQVSREVADGASAGASPAAAAPAAVWVEFSKTGEWNGAQVLDTLSAQIAVPEAMKAAILAGPKAMASYCVALRDRVNAAPADPAQQAERQQIANSLTTRVTELFYATSRSPLQYRQLADVARWAGDYGGAAGPAATPGAHPEQAAAAGAKSNQAAEELATRLATAAGARLREGDKDQIRDAKFQANDEHPGSESGNPALAGWTFLRDPFDNTVTAVRPDGTGLQFTYQVEAGEEGAGAPKVTLIRTLELTTLRVGALKRQDKMAPIELQEDAGGPARRRARDKANGDAARAQFRVDHASEMTAWDDAMTAWTEGGKQGAAPPPPKGYPKDLKTTSCTATPTDVYHAAGGDASHYFPFTPETKWQSWRTLATHPEGPSPGDVYYLWNVKENMGAHMGVFKSATQVSGQEDLWTWVVTDGGQGGYEQIQQAQERTRGPFNKKSGIFSSSIAEAGQNKGDRKLWGWVDIDAYRANPEPVTVPKKK
jgi:hypothetical protein